MIKNSLTDEEFLSRLYYTPRSESSFSSIQALYEASKKSDRSITKSQIKRWLSQQDTFTLHKQIKHKFARRKTIVAGLNKQLQADLVDLSSIKRENNNYKFLLTAIDIFSRFAYAIPIKNKTGAEVKRGFQIIFSDRYFNKVQVDDGKEFWNSTVKEYFIQERVVMFSTNSGQKCALVERFNRTLKNKMFKYFTANNTLRYIDVLTDLVFSYNSRKHSSIGIAPIAVNKQNEKLVWKKQYTDAVRSLRVKLKYKIGDIVRIVRLKKTFEKGYLPNFTKELFTIEKAINTKPPTYYLSDSNKEILKGAFYEQEMQKIG